LLTLTRLHYALALLRGHGGEGGPLLFDFRAAALRALDSALVVFCERQNQRELLLAGSANVFIMRHGFLLGGDDRFSVSTKQAGQLPRPIGTAAGLPPSQGQRRAVLRSS